MERYSHRVGGGDRNDDYDNREFDPQISNLSSDSHYHDNQNQNHHHRRNRHNHPSNRSMNDSTGGSNNSAHSVRLCGRKRDFIHSSQASSDVVKLYVGAVPRVATEEDIRKVFGEYGKIVEVIFINDKRTGQQQECCFVKFTKLEEADRAVNALHEQYTFPGGTIPIKVKYADGELERLGVGGQTNKLYVGSMNKQASKWDLEEIFSPFGVIEDIYILRDELKQNRGSAFVKFLHREMAISAINALHGTFVMRGCEQPLIVRFADPKKPRLQPHAPDLRGQCMLPNDSLAMSPKKSIQIGTKSENVLSNSMASTPMVVLDTGIADTLDCDWSEHICPDGFKYYYNCLTCESRWEKPGDFILCEQQLDKLQLLRHPFH